MKKEFKSEKCKITSKSFLEKQKNRNKIKTDKLMTYFSMSFACQSLFYYGFFVFPRMICWLF